MAQVIITINYREYAISCDNGQEIQIMKLGRLLDEKAKALTAALGHINENQLLAMVGLLIADELSELKKAAAAKEKENTAAQTQTPLPADAASAAELAALDAELANSINSLNEAIKSVASDLKSV